MVDWIETHINLIGAGTSIGALIVSLGTFVLLIINAVLIWRYVKQTKRQADATTVIAKSSRAEFEPNVQIIFKEHIENILGSGTQKGIVYYLQGALLAEVDLVNLSKGISEFWIEFDELNCYIRTNYGDSYVKAYDIYGNDELHLILKPEEKIDYKIFFTEISKEGGNRTDVIYPDKMGIVKLLIRYQIKYVYGYEDFYENRFMEFHDMIKLDDEHFLFVGEWSNVERKYRAYVAEDRRKNEET